MLTLWLFLPSKIYHNSGLHIWGAVSTVSLPGENSTLRAGCIPIWCIEMKSCMGKHVEPIPASNLSQIQMISGPIYGGVYRNATIPIDPDMHRSNTGPILGRVKWRCSVAQKWGSRTSSSEWTSQTAPQKLQLKFMEPLDKKSWWSKSGRGYTSLWAAKVPLAIWGCSFDQTCLPAHIFTKNKQLPKPKLGGMWLHNERTCIIHTQYTSI